MDEGKRKDPLIDDEMKSRDTLQLLQVTIIDDYVEEEEDKRARENV